jgi:hypothetical protein
LREAGRLSVPIWQGRWQHRQMNKFWRHAKSSHLTTNQSANMVSQQSLPLGWQIARGFEFRPLSWWWCFFCGTCLFAQTLPTPQLHFLLSHVLGWSTSLSLRNIQTWSYGRL